MLEPELEAFLTKAFSKHFLLKSVPAAECKALVLSMKVKHSVPGEDTSDIEMNDAHILKAFKGHRKRMFGCQLSRMAAVAQVTAK